MLKWSRQLIPACSKWNSLLKTLHIGSLDRLVRYLDAELLAAAPVGTGNLSMEPARDFARGALVVKEQTCRQN